MHKMYLTINSTSYGSEASPVNLALALNMDLRFQNDPTPHWKMKKNEIGK